MAELRDKPALMDELQSRTDRWWLRTLERIISRVTTAAQDPCSTDDPAKHGRGVKGKKGASVTSGQTLVGKQ